MHKAHTFLIPFLIVGLLQGCSENFTDQVDELPASGDTDAALLPAIPVVYWVVNGVVVLAAAAAASHAVKHTIRIFGEEDLDAILAGQIPEVSSVERERAARKLNEEICRQIEQNEYLAQKTIRTKIRVNRQEPGMLLYQNWANWYDRGIARKCEMYSCQGFKWHLGVDAQQAASMRVLITQKPRSVQCR